MRNFVFVLTAVCLPTTTFGASEPVASKQPLKVFILCGQSNMQGHAHVRTFEHVGMDPKTAPLLKAMQDENGKPIVCKNVWISSIGSSNEEKTGQLTVGYGAERGGPKIGPEFTFGIYAQKAIKEPILIIKTAWGGKSIHTDFRPPSAGPFVFRDEQIAQLEKQKKDVAKIKADKVLATGHYYRLMLAHVKQVLSDIKRVYPDYDADAGYELAGFVWFQGWNDMVGRDVYPKRDQAGGYDDYSKVLAHFIRDVRKDLSAPKMPFVIGVLGVNGPVSKYKPNEMRYAKVHQNFRDAMAAPATMPEFKGNVTAVLTENYWDMQLKHLRSRNGKISQLVRKKQKEDKLDRDAVRKLQDELRSKEFTEQELAILAKGVSNAEFHYLGSAKILGQIGKGFAEAVVKLQPQP